MRHLAVFGRVAGVAIVASAWLCVAPAPVAAECSFLPPLPKISMAIPTARELFVGEVVATGNGTVADFSVRVDEVLRGPAKVGDIRRFRYVAPNWPWGGDYSGGQPFASCSTLRGKLGETVAMAVDARWPGGTVHDDGLTWYQPPTTYQTMAVIGGNVHEQNTGEGRQVFSLKRLREMAALFPPPTDTLDAPATQPSTARGWADLELAVVIALGLLGSVAGWRRTRARSS